MRNLPPAPGFDDDFWSSEPAPQQASQGLPPPPDFGSDFWAADEPEERGLLSRIASFSPMGMATGGALPREIAGRWQRSGGGAMQAMAGEAGGFEDGSRILSEAARHTQAGLDNMQSGGILSRIGGAAQYVAGPIVGGIQGFSRDMTGAAIDVADYFGRTARFATGQGFDSDERPASDTLQRAGEWLAERGTERLASNEEARPERPESIRENPGQAAKYYGFELGAMAGGDIAPSILAAVLTRRVSPNISNMGQAGVASGTLGVQAGGETYQRAIDEGASHDDAFNYAVFVSLAEGLTSMAPARIAFKAADDILKGVAGRAVSAGAAGGGAEVVNNAVQMAYETNMDEFDVSFDEFLARTMDALVLGAGAGSSMSLGVDVADRFGMQATMDEGGPPTDDSGLRQLEAEILAAEQVAPVVEAEATQRASERLQSAQQAIDAMSGIATNEAQLQGQSDAIADMADAINYETLVDQERTAAFEQLVEAREAEARRQQDAAWQQRSRPQRRTEGPMRRQVELDQADPAERAAVEETRSIQAAEEAAARRRYMADSGPATSQPFADLGSMVQARQRQPEQQETAEPPALERVDQEVQEATQAVESDQQRTQVQQIDQQVQQLRDQQQDSEVEVSPELPAPVGAPNLRAQVAEFHSDVADQSFRDRPVRELDDAQLLTEITTSREAGLPNAVALREAPDSQNVASLDVDSLKWVNDNMGHDAGDALIAAVGRAIRDERLDGYHLSGDEFLIRAPTASALRGQMNRLKRRLGSVTIEGSDGGQPMRKRGIEFSWGRGRDRSSADVAMLRQKVEREARGERASMGSTPPGIIRVEGDAEVALPGPTPRRMTPSQIQAEVEARRGESPPEGVRVIDGIEVPARDNTPPSQMNREQRIAALMTSHVTGLPSARRYAQEEKLPVQAMADADSLKWVNDNMGHEAGDQMLAMIGKVLKDHGLDAYHRSGDEFIVQGGDGLGLQISDAQRTLRDAQVVVEDADGNRIIKEGIGLTFASANDLTTADQRLNDEKRAAEDRGERTPRGTEPPGVRRESAQDRQVLERDTEGQSDRGNVAADTGGDAAQEASRGQARGREVAAEELAGDDGRPGRGRSPEGAEQAADLDSPENLSEIGDLTDGSDTDVADTPSPAQDVPADIARRRELTTTPDPDLATDAAVAAREEAVNDAISLIDQSDLDARSQRELRSIVRSAQRDDVTLVAGDVEYRVFKIDDDAGNSTFIVQKTEGRSTRRMDENLTPDDMVDLIVTDMAQGGSGTAVRQANEAQAKRVRELARERADRSSDLDLSDHTYENARVVEPPTRQDTQIDDGLTDIDAQDSAMQDTDSTSSDADIGRGSGGLFRLRKGGALAAGRGMSVTGAARLLAKRGKGKVEAEGGRTFVDFGAGVGRIEVLSQAGDGLPANTQGVTRPDGTIAIVADQHATSADLTATMRHEVTHVAMKDASMSWFRDNLLRYVKDSDKIAGAVNEAMARNPGMKIQSNEMAAEVMSIMSENRDRGTIMDRIVATVRDVMARFGLVDQGYAEVQRAITDANRFVRMENRSRADALSARRFDEAPSQMVGELQQARAVTVGDRVKRMAKRGFLPDGNMGSAARVLRRAKSEISGEKARADAATRTLKKAVRKHYGDSDAVMKKLHNLLNNKELLERADINPDVKAQLLAMREHIDNMSNRMIQQGMLSDDMQGRIEENLGLYMRRSFRIFEDKSFQPSTAALNRVESMLRQDMPDATDQEIRDAMNRIMSAREVGGSAGSTAALARDMSQFIRRKEIPREIREAWGEYENPLYNYPATVARMSQFVAHTKMLQGLTENFKGDMFFDKPTDHNGQVFDQKVAAWNDFSMVPLNRDAEGNAQSIYTSREVAQAIDDILGITQDNGWIRGWMKANTAAKLAKTVYSVQTHVRNFWGGGFMALNSGNLSPQHMRGSLRAVLDEFGGRLEGVDYVAKLHELGVINESVAAGEVQAMLRDQSGGALDIRKAINAKNPLSRMAKTMLNLYKSEDSFWRIVIFEGEKARYREAMPELSDSQLDSYAADLVNALYPTYDRVPRAIQELRKFPAAGTFVSWPYEVIRTQVNGMAQIAQEVKHNNPKVRSIGYRRMAGMAAAQAASIGLFTMLSRWMFNVSAEEEESIRHLLPHWSRNSSLFHLGRDEDGISRTVDLSYTLPHDQLWRMGRAMMTDANGEGVGERAAVATWEGLKPFLGEDMVFGSVIGAIYNRKSSGAPLYRPNATPQERATAVVGEIAQNWIPGTAISGHRIFKAITGETRLDGRKYEMETELMSPLLGLRPTVIDAKVAMRFRAGDYARMRSSISMQLNDTLRTDNANVTDEQVREAYNRFQAGHERHWRMMRRTVEAGMVVGATREEMFQVLRDNNTSRDVARSLVNGDYRPAPADIRRRFRDAQVWVSQQPDDESRAWASDTIRARARTMQQAEREWFKQWREENGIR